MRTITEMGIGFLSATRCSVYGLTLLAASQLCAIGSTPVLHQVRTARHGTTPRYSLRILQIGEYGQAASVLAYGRNRWLLGSLHTPDGRRGFVIQGAISTLIPTFWEDKDRPGHFIGNSFAYDANIKGDVVGFAETEGSRMFDIVHGDDRAFIWRHGSFLLLPRFTSSGPTRAFAINDAGTVVGEAVNETNFSHQPCAWYKQKIVPLPGLGGQTGSAHGINRFGSIVGDSANSKGNDHASLWINKKVIDLGTLGGATSSANTINDSGIIVGASTVSVSEIDHACLWKQRRAIDIHPRGYFTSEAFAVNGKGEVVGAAKLSKRSSLRSGFVYIRGHSWDLNKVVLHLRGWRITGAHGIDDKGAIAVNLERRGNFAVGLLTPFESRTNSLSFPWNLDFLSVRQGNLRAVLRTVMVLIHEDIGLSRFASNNWYEVGCL
jgi:probable HAF family extracellular repeat protein